MSGAALEILEWRLLKRHNWKDEAGPNGAVAGAVVQATLRLRSELECERAFFNVVGSVALGLPALLLALQFGEWLRTL